MYLPEFLDRYIELKLSKNHQKQFQIFFEENLKFECYYKVINDNIDKIVIYGLDVNEKDGIKDLNRWSKIIYTIDPQEMMFKYKYQDIDNYIINEKIHRIFRKLVKFIKIEIFEYYKKWYSEINRGDYYYSSLI